MDPDHERRAPAVVGADDVDAPERPRVVEALRHQPCRRTASAPSRSASGSDARRTWFRMSKLLVVHPRRGGDPAGASAPGAGGPGGGRSRRDSTRSRRRSTETGCPSGAGSVIASFRVCPAIASDSRRRIRVSSALSRSIARRLSQTDAAPAQGLAPDAPPRRGCPRRLLDRDLSLHAHLPVVVDRAVELVLAGLGHVHGERAALPGERSELSSCSPFGPSTSRLWTVWPSFETLNVTCPALTVGSDGIELEVGRAEVDARAPRRPERPWWSSWRRWCRSSHRRSRRRPAAAVAASGAHQRRPCNSGRIRRASVASCVLLLGGRTDSAWRWLPVELGGSGATKVLEPARRPIARRCPRASPPRSTRPRRSLRRRRSGTSRPEPGCRRARRSQTSHRVPGESRGPGR